MCESTNYSRAASPQLLKLMVTIFLSSNSTEAAIMGRFKSNCAKYFVKMFCKTYMIDCTFNS